MGTFPEAKGSRRVLFFLISRKISAVISNYWELLKWFVSKKEEIHLKSFNTSFLFLSPLFLCYPLISLMSSSRPPAHQHRAQITMNHVTSAETLNRLQHKFFLIKLLVSCSLLACLWITSYYSTSMTHQSNQQTIPIHVSSFTLNAKTTHSVPPQPILSINSVCSVSRNYWKINMNILGKNSRWWKLDDDCT